MKTEQGENLLFILSQPRSGSTLLQRILGSHSDIMAASETWLMLHPVYGLRQTGHTAEYNALGAYTFTREFLQRVPDGENVYLEGIRQFGLHIYQQALAKANKQYFVDKTPRYYFILPELFRVFPKARYIFLFRNPLAILYSIYKTWLTDNLFALAHLRPELRQAPRLLLEGIDLLQEQALVIHYESLVRHPEPTLRRLCQQLQIDFQPQMIAYGSSEMPHWRFGDQKVYNHEQPVSDKAEQWRDGLSDAQFWRLAQEYLNGLGADWTARMGYDFDELAQAIQEKAPTRFQLWPTASLNWLLKKDEQERPKWERGLLKIMRWFQARLYNEWQY